MVDNRKIKAEIKDKLPAITESEILLNFSYFLEASFPYLLKIDAYCYDPFDEFVENNFLLMVHDVLLYKYDITVQDRKCLYQYGYSGCLYSNMFHIELLPKKYPVKINFNNKEKIFTENDIMNDKIKFIFKSFSNGIHNLTGSYKKDEIKNYLFNMVEIDIINKKGLVLLETKNDYITVDKKEFEFEYILEDN